MSGYSDELTIEVLQRAWPTVIERVTEYDAWLGELLQSCEIVNLREVVSFPGRVVSIRMHRPEYLYRVKAAYRLIGDNLSAVCNTTLHAAFE